MVVTIRLIRNISITILSGGWIVPTWKGVEQLCWWEWQMHQPNYHELGDSGVNLQIGGGLISIGLLWLALVIAFWAFVAANRLWPIKCKETKPEG